MNNWIKFKDEIPKDGMILWVSDGDKVWPELAYSEEDRKNEHNLFWMERINPEPPDKEKHCCSVVSGPYLFEAYETESVFHPEMFLKISKKDFLFHLPIEFCPFCGFTLEKKC